MPPTSFASGGVRAVVPESYDVREAARERALPGEPGFEQAAAREAMLTALEESGLETAERLELAPRRARDLPAPSPDSSGPAVPSEGVDSGATRRGSGAATATLEVDVGPEEDAVVLLERDGVYSWQLPTDAGERTRSIDLSPRTARFEIDLDGTTDRAGAGSEPSGIRPRGLLGDAVKGAVQALVLRFAAPLVDHAIERMEDHVRTGLVHLTGTDVTAWRRFERLDELGLPTDRPVRLLLLIHGTFSSTAGGFAAFGSDENAMGLLRTALGAYDAVIGYDHRTLSIDPRQNAKDLLERLSAHHPQADLVIDVITHSRGGLTTRSLVEYELPQSDWPGRVDRVVFVGATNGGTHLADPERWRDLVDLYTNLVSVGAGAVAALPGGAPAAAVVAGVVRGIGALVKYLVSYAAEGDGVPGLAAMVPDGAFVTDLNTLQAGQPGPGTQWFVIASNFHVDLADDSHRPPEFPRELVVRLAEGFVDGLFDGDNDLVVDTASMSAIGLPDGGFVADARVLASNDRVYHTNYFAQVDVIEAIAGWLPLGMGASEPVGVGAEPEPEPRERDLPMAPLPPPSRDLPMAPAPAPPPSRDLPMAPPPPSPSPETPLPDEPASGGPPTEATVAAEMPAVVSVEDPFDVRILLSRKDIKADDDMVHVSTVVAVQAERPVSVQVVGKSNAEVVGTDSDILGLPLGGGESSVSFQVRALAVGPVVVNAIVRQGRVPLATLSLEATAVTELALGAPDPPARAEIHTGIDAPELDGLPCLDIIESARPDGSVVYKYAVRIEQDGPGVAFQSLPIQDRARTMAGFLEEVQELVGADLSEAQLLRKLQDLGTRLYDALFPEEMQAYLWKHRHEIGDLIVYADEPYVPWELVHLKPPKGQRGQEPRFLAQGGLVRWRLGSFPPKEIRVREGRARSLIPDYRDPQYVLSEPVHEATYLAGHFGATPVRATPTGVVQLLRSGRFDLLHFSGHGAADVEDILGARILLQGRKRGRTVEPQFLSATEVSENARWVPAHEAGPIVVLNACQTGREGILLTTAGGFADAFLDAGASAFVSCLWSVHQQPSRTFVETLYDELLAGTPMARATARARQAARDKGDATWLAFVVYARPDAVLTRT
ncbi:CHAT domain-containing protein [Intrasporangium calvum]|uniref:CHAT domain-containing protein n=1 Tax=Intrasporangium calvum TaxID=53358 RepID=A0ABT5GIL5_9MICO|nr:CHAT domain-containing protein [Intrasporangium calvum]MDC5697740.1 CHAT domain-containing protein [Intrasporangium calvum]